MAAIFGEISACIVRVPMEIVKQRAQTMPNRRIRQIVKEIYTRNEGGGGLRGFYRGEFKLNSPLRIDLFHPNFKNIFKKIILHFDEQFERKKIK